MVLAQQVKMAWYILETQHESNYNNVLIHVTWVKVPNFQNPELLKLKS